MLQQWFGVTKEALCNIHRAAVGLRDPCITLDKCNDVFRQNGFCWVCIVPNASSAYILLISDDMTVSVRAGISAAGRNTSTAVMISATQILLFSHENGFTIYCAQCVHKGLACAL